MTDQEMQVVLDQYPRTIKLIDHWHNTLVPAGINKNNWNKTKSQTKYAEMVRDMNNCDVEVALALLDHIVQTSDADLPNWDWKFVHGVQQNIPSGMYDKVYRRHHCKEHTDKWRLIMILLDITGV